MVLVLVAVHAVVLYYGLSHLALSALLLAAAIVVLVIKRAALPGRIQALFRRRSHNAREIEREYREG